MQRIKETAANVGASAKSGMEKTKATVAEKMERMTAHNPTEKEMATDRKEERIHHAELNKQEARQQNAAANQAVKTGGSYAYTTTGMAGHQMSSLPGQPATEGTIGSHPVGTATGTGRPSRRPSTAHNTHVSGGGGTCG